MRTKLLSLMLAAVLLFSFSGCAELAAGRASDETVFEVALEDLKQYRDVQSVREAEEMFGQIMSDYNSSSLFQMYAGVIRDILEGSFTDVELVLGRLAERGSFVKLLKEYGLPSCENLIRYVKARTAEAAGDYAAASEIYADLDVFDSVKRLIELDVQREETQAPRYAEAEAEFVAGHYAAAAEIWRELGDYRDSAERMAESVELGATPTPSPTPSPPPSPTPTPEPTQVPRSAWPTLKIDKNLLGDCDLQKDQIITITFMNNLSGVPADAWDISNAWNGSILAWVEPHGSYYDLFIAGKGGVRAPENSWYLFGSYKRLTTINFNECFDTSSVIDMSFMFNDCGSLQNLDLSSFDTSNVTDMGSMFSGCGNLHDLDLSSFDTSNVTDMSHMFSECGNLQNLNLSSFNTSNATSMRWMFWRCSSLQNLNLSSFDTSNVTDMSYMFSDCSNLQNVDLSSFDTSNVTDMECMFYECSSLYNLRTSTSFVIRDDTDTGWMFVYCPIQSIN